jgi:hypothetical protein
VGRTARCLDAAPTSPGPWCDLLISLVARDLLTAFPVKLSGSASPIATSARVRGVLTIFHGCDPQASVQIVEAACRRFMTESVHVEDPPVLTISARVAIETDPARSPAAGHRAADRAQYRAKEASRLCSPRPSVIAVEGGDELIAVEA